MKKNLIKSFSIVLALLMVVAISPLTTFAAVDKAPAAPVAKKSASTSSTAPKVTNNAPTTTDEGTKVVNKNAATQTTAKTPAAEVSNFGFKPAELVALYKGYSGTFMVSPIPENATFVAALNEIATGDSAKKVTMTAEDAAKSIEASYMAVFHNGLRRIYTLVGSNTVQIGADFYTVPAATYDKLKAIYGTDYKRANYAQWLIHMKPANITSISYETGKESVAVNPQYTAEITRLIRSLRVTTGESYSPKLTDFAPTGENVRVTIKLGETSTYTVMIKGNVMYVENDELHIGCKYTVSTTDAAKLIATLKNPAAPATTPATTPAVTPAPAATPAA